MKYELVGVKPEYIRCYEYKCSIVQYFKQHNKDKKRLKAGL